MARVYLDWNATAPLCAQAREAMIAAMDVVGNPSSVHTEGRSAKKLVETARAQVAALLECAPMQVVFTSGSTEGLAMFGQPASLRHGSSCSHDAAFAWIDGVAHDPRKGCDGVNSQIVHPAQGEVSFLEIANGETGAVTAPHMQYDASGGLLYRRASDNQSLASSGGVAVLDATQAIGKIALRSNELFEGYGVEAIIGSAHKLGGPKGVGVIILREGFEWPALLRGGGQEMGRRAGTENVVGIAGFGAAAEAAQGDLERDVWQSVAKLRNILEKSIAQAVPGAIFVSNTMQRLPNTSCIITPRWRGETQVMLMDLAGFAISAGSACSSGKVRESRVLRALGYDREQARCAIRVSLGPTTTEDEVTRFAAAWVAAHQKHTARSS